MDTAISRYAKAKGISETEAIKQFKELNKSFNSLYGTGGLGLGTFDINNDNQRPAHDAMGAAFKKDPALFEAFNDWRSVNGGGSVKDALESANNSLGFKDGARGIVDGIIGTESQNEAYSDLFGAYGFTENADGSFSEPFYKEQGKKAADEAVNAATPATDAEVKAAEAEAAAAPKTLDQPEGGAAQAPGGMSMTPEGQTQANLQAKINSMPEDVDLGTGGATKKSRSRMNLQAEADRQAADIIKQQKKASNQNNFLRDRYDATGGRSVGAFDALSSDAKAQAVKNYNANSVFDSSTQAGQDQEELFAKNNPNYTPPKADIQSQYEAASMNPPSVASADGTATTEEFGSMSPAQQRAFIQNYKYNPQGQSPETVEEGTMMGAQASSNPEVNLETLTVPQGQREVAEYQTSNQTVPGQYMPPERVYPAPDSTLEGGRGGIDVNESFKQNPALQTDGSGNILPPPDGPGDDITTYSPPDVSNLPPIEDVFSKLPEAPQKPQTPYSPPDVSNLPPIEDVFSKLPEAPGRPQQEPAPAPASRAPTPPPTQPKPQGQSPVYGKKDDGTYGVVGYRDNREMKKGMGGTRIKEWTASMDRDRREDDFMNRARQGQVSNPLNSEYNRALGQQNEDAFAKRRAQQAEFARKSAREKELAAMPTPRANAAMDIMNGLPQADQVGIVNQYRKRRGEKPIFNPYSA